MNPARGFPARRSGQVVTAMPLHSASRLSGIFNEPRSEKRSGPNDRQGFVSFGRSFGSRRVARIAVFSAAPAQRHPPTAFQRDANRATFAGSLRPRPNIGKETCALDSRSW
jgi:hypothetical protein